MSLLSLKKMRNLHLSPKPKEITILQDSMTAGIREAQSRKMARQATMPPGFKASCLGGSCLRCSLYSYLRVPTDRELDVKAQLMMKLGHAVHSAMKSILRETLDVIELNPGEDKEFKVQEPSWPLVGFLDSLVVHEGELWLLEIKSVNKYVMKALETPKHTHLIQTAIYLELFNRLLATGHFADHARLKDFSKLAGTAFYYVNRDFGDAKEFWVLPKPELFQQVETEIGRVKSYVERRRLPERSEECARYSDYNKKCHESFDPYKT